MVEISERNKRLLEELAQFESEINELPSKFGLINGIGSKFDYQKGKLRFDSWLARFTCWLLKNIPGTKEEVSKLKSQYSDNNCNPIGSGYGLPHQMVNTVFVRPFVNKIDSLREDIYAGHFENVYKDEPNHSSSDYVSPIRIKQIVELSGKFDYSKLAMMLNELNIAYKNGMFYSVGCLIRAIIDHVPPVFGCNSFKEIANNYQGTKSFKDAMKGLDEQMRKITDSYLHTQIRSKEVAPVEQQIEARSAIDFLLSELIRIS